MTHKFWHTLMLTWLLIITSSSYAIPSDDDVAAWTEKILIQTFTVSYKELIIQSQADELRQFYSGQAWSGLNDFFSDYMPFIIKHKLTTHPVPVAPAKVVKKGIFNGANYWRVNQTLEFPKVGRKLWLSVIVIESSDPPLRIESLDMAKE